MPDSSVIPWRWLEDRRSTAFLVGGTLFVVAAAFNVVDIAVGAERLNRLFGQTVIAAAWIATFGGLLGLYPGLADRSRWLARAGAVATAIGVAGFTVIGAVAFAFYAGLLGGTFESYLPVFLPLVLVGCLLPFPAFSAASLHSGVHSRTVGLLLLAPTVIFLVNFLTPNPSTVVLAITGALAVVHFAIGFLLRAERVATDREGVGTSRDPSAG